jgi:peptidoglycan biosynthesis protein MviN/MurJ (putative lipid II flippase)
MMMFDAQITVALFAAFLLGMIAGSGIEIIVRGGRR